MVKKKKGMKECPVCKCSLKPENYKGHMRNVHGKTVEEDAGKSEEYRPKTKRERQGSKRAELRRIKLEERQKMMKITGVVVAVLIVVIGLSAYYIVSMKDGLGTGTPAETINPEEGKIRIIVSDINDGQIHYYSSKDTIFYVHRNPIGNIHTRIRYCGICSGTDFVLENEGNIIVCTTCNVKWDSETYSETGGCVACPPPPYLQHIIENGYIIIQESDLTK
ncbi:MAG: DUF2318 domain-containing protein [Thermoplasmatales archaeon]|nr:DUF2318 domain-containing protein [Thermoplasmatales archaeon]